MLAILKPIQAFKSFLVTILNKFFSFKYDKDSRSIKVVCKVEQEKK